MGVLVMVGGSCGVGVHYVQSRISCKGRGKLSKPRVWVNTTNQNSHTISPSSFTIAFSIFRRISLILNYFTAFSWTFFLEMTVTKYA